MKPKPAKSQPAAPPAPATPAPAVTAANLDQKTLDLILASDVANIVKKVKAGKPLSASEREILKQRLNAPPTAAAPATTGPTAPAIPSIVTIPEREVNKGGRPRFKIDYRLVASLAGIQCTITEIASILECNAETLERDAKFCALYKKKVDGGRMCLRRHQWKAVEAGNATMMIWLGKQYLKQTDRTELTGILKPEAGPDLTAERIAAMPTPELRRLLGPASTDNIIDVVATPASPEANGHGANGSNGNGKPK